MGEERVSEWAVERFGAAAADELVHRVPRAILAAHQFAMSAHAGSGLPSNDAYGATLAQQQHLQLIEFTQDIPGVALRKPAGLRSRHRLVVVGNVLVQPWRYSRDAKIGRLGARMTPMSDLRRTLFKQLAATERPRPVQGTVFDDFDTDYDQIEAEAREEAQVLRELAALGRVVTVGFGSTPAAGVFGLGWGDVHVDEDGYPDFGYWEDLPFGELGEGRLSRDPLAPVGDSPASARFDDGAEEVDFGMSLRSPLAPPPISEPQPSPPETGNDTTE